MNFNFRLVYLAFRLHTLLLIPPVIWRGVMVKMKMDFKDETGAVYPLALFLIPVLIVLAGLIIDIGMGVYQHTKLTSAVDAAAIATLDAYDREKWEEDEIIEIDPSQARGLAT